MERSGIHPVGSYCRGIQAGVDEQSPLAIDTKIDTQMIGTLHRYLVDTLALGTLSYNFFALFMLNSLRCHHSVENAEKFKNNSECS